MSVVQRRNPRTAIPDLIDWFEGPFLSLRPYQGQPIRVEEDADDRHFVVRAELAGIDPDKDLEVTVDSGYLTIRAQRTDKSEGARRSEFRYGSFTRSVALPAGADEDDVTASYRDGILTVTVGTKGEKKEAAKKVQVTTGK